MSELLIEPEPSFSDSEAPSPEQRAARDEPTLDAVPRVCLVILAVLAVFYTLYFARAILLPLTLALMGSIVLKPVTRRMEAAGLPGILSASLIFLVLTAVTIFGTVRLSGPVSDWLERAPQSFAKAGSRVKDYLKPLAQIKAAQQQVDEMTKLPGEEKNPDTVRVEQPAIASETINATGAYLASASITLFMLFFLLAAGDRYLEKTVEIIPTWRGKRDAVMLARDVQSRIASYLGMITLINIGLGIVVGLGLWWVGMPNPVLWGVLAGVLNFIPVAGLLIGVVLTLVVGLAELPTIGQALAAPSIYLLANGIEANFITPAVLGRSISLNPVVILLAVFFWGWIWGMGGVLLAVPMLIVAKIVCESNESLKPYAVFLSP
ncbi:AI-2 transport protein TqsA [Pirellulimonas nuda]|uniref:AI-2 transport protein TqsA n=1 Tax=Pirellulimonas nuda TaxID=2528009 RepID=A0A518D7P0_9BACT|nr:AI-2E family transporter [Pirellulimonas nuda]QDU87469.1 AI-2 transport protein TqsA [Pirellulimonas nuda]